VRATNAIIARFFVVVTLQRRTNHLYYVYLRGTWMARPRRVSFVGAAGAASVDAGTAAAPPLGLFDLGLREGAREALRLLL